MYVEGVRRVQNAELKLSGLLLETGHALVVLFTFFQDEHAYRFSRQDHRPQSIGELIDVQDFETLHLGEFIQIEIVGDNLGT
jgi:hypothetical protein